MTGQRGKGDTMAMLEGAMAALKRAIDLEDIRDSMPRVSQIDMNRALAQQEAAQQALAQQESAQQESAQQAVVQHVVGEHVAREQAKLREDKLGIEVPPQLSEFEQLKAEADAARKKTDEQLAKLQASVEICENCTFADDDNGWGGENLNDPAECTCADSPKFNKYVDRIDTCDYFMQETPKSAGALDDIADAVLEDLTAEALEAAIGKPQFEPGWLSTGRTHVECGGCAKEKIMPAPCSGHAEGPSTCSEFEPWQNDETEDPTKVME